MAGADSLAEGNRKQANPFGRAWVRAVPGGTGGQSTRAGVERVCGAGKGVGGQGSRGTVPGFARGAGATRAGRADTSFRNANYRGHGSGAATQGERSRIGGTSGNPRTESATWRTAECESEDRSFIH